MGSGDPDPGPASGTAWSGDLGGTFNSIRAQMPDAHSALGRPTRGDLGHTLSRNRALGGCGAAAPSRCSLPPEGPASCTDGALASVCRLEAKGPHGLKYPVRTDTCVWHLQGAQGHRSQKEQGEHWFSLCLIPRDPLRNGDLRGMWPGATALGGKGQLPAATAPLPPGVATAPPGLASPSVCVRPSGRWSGFLITQALRQGV